MKLNSRLSNLALSFLTGFSLLPTTFTHAHGNREPAQAKTWGEILGIDPNSCTYKLATELGMSPFNFRDSQFSLEAKYCERMKAGTWDSAFAEGKDLPAELLNTNQAPTQLESLSTGIEVENLIEFNNQAGSLWSELVSCHGSAEKARQAYLKLDSKCGLNQKIQNYALSVQSYLMTTMPSTREGHHFVAFHPLLTEILLENAHATSWLPGLDPLPKNDLKYLKGLVTELIYDGTTIGDLENTQSPEILRRVFIKHGHLQLLHQDKQIDIQWLMSTQYRQMNAVILLRDNRAKDCASLGLWPGVSRLITHQLGKDFNTHKLGTDDLLKSYANACGDMRYTPSPYGGESRASLEILKEFRKLSVRFK